MQVTLLLRSILLHEDIPSDFNERGVSHTGIQTNPVYLYLEELMSDDEWYRVRGVVLSDGRLCILGDDGLLGKLEKLPQSERWSAMHDMVREYAAGLLNRVTAGSVHADPDMDSDSAARLVRNAIYTNSFLLDAHSLHSLSAVLLAVEDCEWFPFSREIAEFRDWPFVDVTEYQEEDRDYGTEAVFVVEVNV